MNREELKRLVLESMLETLNTPQGGQEQEKRDFALGQQYAVRDKKFGTTERNLEKQSKAFKKGYQSVMGGGWWQKFNDKLTNFMAGMGSSRLR